MCHPRSAILSVIDTGIGIAAEKLPFIFDRFYQVDASRTQLPDFENDGSGLGLSLVKLIADAHNAMLNVKSVEGKGTTFTVIFTVLHDNLSSSASDGEGMPPSRRTTRKRLLGRESASDKKAVSDYTAASGDT